MSISFYDLYIKLPRKPSRLILCLDPGETTGFAIFQDHQLVRYGEIETVLNEEFQWHNLSDLILSEKFTDIVCEDYRIYQQKLARHSFSPVLTLRLIGAIDFIGWMEDIQVHYQMASQAKGFVNDTRLKDWGYWETKMRHARDAIRHGCYFLLFHK